MIAGDLPSALTRRGFMIGAAGLTFGTATGLTEALAQAAGKDAVLSPWVTISTDGTVSIMSPAAEMGQGSLTSIPLILAEELDADWADVRVVPSPPNDALYGNPQFGYMYTAGSNAVASYFKPVRQFGAQVRKILIANAAKHWDVPVSELSTGPSVVIHERSGRRLRYGEIAAFAQIPLDAPEVKEEELKPTSRFRLIGKDVMRVDMPGKVNGTARYAIDIDVPGLLYGAVLRAPVEGAGPTTIGDAKARAVAGIVAIVPLPYGVGVVAETPRAAFAAKNALEVAWNRSGKAWGFDSAKGGEAFAAAARDLQQKGDVWAALGDAPQALAGAATLVEGEYRCEFVYHAQMEPLNAVAAVAPDGRAVELWAGVQSKTVAVKVAAAALGIAEDKVVYHDMLMGGGFGRRGHHDEEFVLDAVVLSQAVKRPVKSMWTREDDIRNGRFYPLSAHYLRAGFDPAGKLLAIQHRKACDVVSAFQEPLRLAKDKGRDRVSFTGLEAKYYAVPNYLAEAVPQDSGIRTSSLRGVAHLSNLFAIESFVDELALKRGAEPVAFRRGLVASSPRSLNVIDTVTRMSDWSRTRRDTALGFAFTDFAGTLIAAVAEVAVDRATGAIAVPNMWVALDCGIAVQPDSVRAQVEGGLIYGLGFALWERVTMKDGQVKQTNFHDYHVPRLNEVPQIEIDLIVTDNRPTGVGEAVTPLVAPAIANAVAALTGARLRLAPMTHERVLAALKA
jgi:isoquinoline 1-oxidoreductase subunit beta